MKEKHSWRAKLGKGDLTDECRLCLVLKVNASHGTYYKKDDQVLDKCPPCTGCKDQLNQI